MSEMALVTAAEYPHGLRCMDCDDLMPEGTASCEVFDDVCGPFEISVVICPACAIDRGLR